jgi:hypothetical protein
MMDVDWVGCGLWWVRQNAVRKQALQKMRADMRMFDQQAYLDGVDSRPPKVNLQRVPPV